jgi:hypothetical protein
VNPVNFFAELKRRNVYKVAIAYAVIAWLLMQIATQVFPFLEIPNWAIRLVIMLLALGFPIALILAWAFELTPEGIKRAEAADREPAKPNPRRTAFHRPPAPHGDSAVSPKKFLTGLTRLLIQSQRLDCGFVDCASNNQTLVALEICKGCTGLYA